MKKDNWPEGTPVEDRGPVNIYNHDDPKGKSRPKPHKDNTGRLEQMKKDGTLPEGKNLIEVATGPDKRLSSEGQYFTEEALTEIITFIRTHGVGQSDGMTINDAARQLEINVKSVSRIAKNLRGGVIGSAPQPHIDHDQFMDIVQNIELSVMASLGETFEGSQAEIKRRLKESPEEIPVRDLIRVSELTAKTVTKVSANLLRETEQSQDNNRLEQIKDIFSDARQRLVIDQDQE